MDAETIGLGDRITPATRSPAFPKAPSIRWICLCLYRSLLPPSSVHRPTTRALALLRRRTRADGSCADVMSCPSNLFSCGVTPACAGWVVLRSKGGLRQERRRLHQARHCEERSEHSLHGTRRNLKGGSSRDSSDKHRLATVMAFRGNPIDGEVRNLTLLFAKPASQALATRARRHVPLVMVVPRSHSRGARSHGGFFSALTLPTLLTTLVETQLRLRANGVMPEAASMQCSTPQRASGGIV